MTNQELYELQKSGKTCEEIAKEVGLTKNAVVGKIYRHRKANNIASSKGSIYHNPKRKPRVTTNIIPLNIDFIDLKNSQCRYPYGEGPYVFCGHPIQKWSPYCPEHHSLCHTGKTAQRANEINRNSGRKNNRLPKKRKEFKYGGEG